MLSICAHLAHNVFMILLIQVCYLRQANLVATILILILFQVVSSTSHHVGRPAMSAVCDSIASHAHQVRRLVGSVATQVGSRLNVIATSVGDSWHYAFTHVLSILRVVLWLLSIDERHPIDVIVLVVRVLVSTHNQLLFGSFQTNWPYRLGTLAGYVDVGHVLVGAATRLRRDVVLMTLLAPESDRITQLTC